MQKASRRKFLQSVVPVALWVGSFKGFARGLQSDVIHTVRGPISTNQLGIALIHEHILVDFIGAKQIDSRRWDHDKVIDKVLPFLEHLKVTGCNTFVDCTPNYLGRDVLLLRKLAEQSGLHILTNTGYYGGSDHKFLPDHAFTETAEQLSERWIAEFTHGIGGTDIKPGFIKISVNPSTLSSISKKLVKAAALTHLATGLTIASHTGPFVAAEEEIGMLKQQGVHPAALIWVHAQNESDRGNYIKAAQAGVWISLDGLNDDNVLGYVDTLSFMRKEKFLHKVLLSHDAGWFDPAKPGGGTLRGYTTLFEKLIPALKENSFGDDAIRLLIETNPQMAFRIGIKTTKKG
jgi:phosphotriesterase-related protein